jgi:hypothetical protein
MPADRRSARGVFFTATTREPKYRSWVSIFHRKGRDGLSEPSVRMEGHGMVFQTTSMTVIIHYPFAGRLGEAVPAVRSRLVRRSLLGLRSLGEGGSEVWCAFAVKIFV